MRIIAVLVIISSFAYCQTSTKDSAIDEFLQLTKAEEAFRKGAEAGFEVGFDPKNNPGLKLVPKHKLDAIRSEIKELFAKEFTYEKVRDDMKSLVGDSYTDEELKELNAVLKTPIMQKFFQEQIKNIPAQMALGQDAARPLQPKIIAITQKHLLRP